VLRLILILFFIFDTQRDVARTNHYQEFNQTLGTTDFLLNMPVSYWWHVALHRI